MVCRLMKGLYGLKQASRLWYKKLKAALEHMGFKAIYSDNSIYVYAKAEDKEYMKKVPYISAVGSLLFLALATRPNIAHTVSVLCRFNSNPGIAHWKSVKHLFRYLRGTLDYRLIYGPTDSNELFTSFCDADHAGNPDNGRSTSGYDLRIGSGAIS